MLYVCVQGTIEVYDSRNVINVTYNQVILRRKGPVLIFVSRDHQDRTWN